MDTVKLFEDLCKEKNNQMREDYDITLEQAQTILRAIKLRRRNLSVEPISRESRPYGVVK